MLGSNLGSCMPIYAYRCSSCGHAQDVLQKMSDPLLTQCPACGAEAYTKQVTAAGFQLKGSGWYVTDFRNNGGAPAKKADDAGDEKPAEQSAEKSAEQSAEKSAEKPAEKAAETSEAASTDKPADKPAARPGEAATAKLADKAAPPAVRSAPAASPPPSAPTT